MIFLTILTIVISIVILWILNKIIKNYLRKKIESIIYKTIRMSKNNQCVIRVYKSLLLNDIPDDVTSLVLDFTDNITETVEQLANKRCMYKVIKPAVCTHRHWFYKGSLCTICKSYKCFKSKHAINTHFNSKTHKKNLKKYLKSNHKLPEKHDDLLSMWADSVTAEGLLSKKILLSKSKGVSFRLSV